MSELKPGWWGFKGCTASCQVLLNTPRWEALTQCANLKGKLTCFFILICCHCVVPANQANAHLRLWRCLTWLLPVKLQQIGCNTFFQTTSNDVWLSVLSAQIRNSHCLLYCLFWLIQRLRDQQNLESEKDLLYAISLSNILYLDSDYLRPVLAASWTFKLLLYMNFSWIGQ